MKSSILLVSGVVIGGALGFVARDAIIPNQKTDGTASQKSASAPTSNESLPNPESLQDGKSSFSGKSFSASAAPNISPVLMVESDGTPNPVLGILGSARSHREVVQALETLLPRLRGGNPMDLAKSALQMPSGSERDMALMLSLGELAQRSPSEAFRFAESLPPGANRDQALRWIASGMPPGNLERTLELVDGVEDSDLRESIVANVVALEAEHDPAAAMKSLSMIEDQGIRASALAATAQSWAKADPSGALSFAVSSSDPAVRSDLLLALSSSDKADSKEVFNAVLENMPSGSAYQAAISGLFEKWSSQDPSAAAAALTQIPPGMALDSATAQVAAAMAKSPAPKEQIAAWIGAFPEGSSRLEAMESFYSEWGGTDPSGALAEVARLTGKDRSTAVTSLVKSWSGKDPSSVLEWGLRGANGFNEAKGVAIVSGIHGIAQIDPNEAARQLASVPSAFQHDAIDALIEVWSDADADAAAAWLSTKPRTPAIDGAAGRLAISLAREDPETAMQWALAISTPESRREAAREVATLWKQSNPASARAYAAKVSDASLSSLLAE